METKQPSVMRHGTPQLLCEIQSVTSRTSRLLSPSKKGNKRLVCVGVKKLMCEYVSNVAGPLVVVRLVRICDVNCKEHFAD